MAYYWAVEMVVVTADLMDARKVDWKADLMVSVTAD